MIAIIVATAKNNVIGAYGDMPWRGKLPADLKHFAKQTSGQAVIMGRVTYESIPAKYRPLKGRINIIISATKDFSGEGCVMAKSLGEALDYANSMRQNAFIAGGGGIYREALNGNYKISKIYRTLIDVEVDGDVFFPELGKSWRLIEESCHEPDDRNKYGYCFQVYERARL